MSTSWWTDKLNVAYLYTMENYPSTKKRIKYWFMLHEWHLKTSYQAKEVQYYGHVLFDSI